MTVPAWFDGCVQPRADGLRCGVFETMRLRAGGILRLDSHLARLERGAHALGFALRGDERSELERYVQAHGLMDCALRLALEPGPDTVHLSIAARTPRSVPAEGVWLVPLDAPRLARDPLCIHKRTERGLYEFAHALAAGQGAFDAVLLDPEGNLVECATANLHALIDGQWWSPGAREGALPGLEREDFLGRCGPWREAAIPPGALRRAEAVVLTNSVLGEIPVHAIGTGGAGNFFP